MGAHSISPRIRSILESRGIVDDTSLNTYLFPDFVRDCHNPLLLGGVIKAAERVLSAVQQSEKVAIYADFDCDGIPAAVVMHDLFLLLGHSNVTFYIPDRDAEGFGFHMHAIDTLRQQGVSLIITVDVGAASPDTVRYAQSCGVDVIVTDHHEYGEVPPAYAFVHPGLEEYPFRHLCGAGVAFKFAQAVIQYGVSKEISACTAIVPGMEKWMLDMVALATIADMVPLTGENRCLVHFGIQVLRKSRRPGIRALCKVARITQSAITEDDIGFAIAPRVNAASRMSSPHLAFQLFTTTDNAEAERLARELDSLNTKRKALTASITKQIKKRLNAMSEIPVVIVLGASEYKPALLGSVATSLVQTYKRPVCLWGREHTGVFKGSARTDGSVSVVTLLQGAGDVLLQSGGHEGAGGFAIDSTKLHILEQKLCESYIKHARSGVSPKVHSHELLQMHDVTFSLVRELDLLRPFGEGNPKPLWGVFGRAETIRAFGKELNHTEIVLTHENGTRLRTYQFFRAPEDFNPGIQQESTVGIIGTLERNAFRGSSIEMRIVAIAT